MAMVLLAAFYGGAATTPTQAEVNADTNARLEADPCACIFQSQVLDSNIYDNYPSSDPGQYQNYTGIARYGTFCAAHDFMAGTPWKESCGAELNFGIPANNWCQEPWCYVNESCASAVSSSVFDGSSVAFYSYAACGAADCYSNGVSALDAWDKTTPDGCPYDPNGDNTYTVFKSGDCACLYHGENLAADIYTNYPSKNPGQYENYLEIQSYGTTCAAWDQAMDTPWYSSCPLDADWCDKTYNWCQAPWCYVNGTTCDTKVPSSVFAGSPVAFYSYDTCLSTPDCYTDIAFADDWCESFPDNCPVEKSTNGFYTSHVECDDWCPPETTGQPDQAQRTWSATRGFAVLLTFLAMAERFAIA